MANFEFDHYLGNLLSALAKVKQTVAGIPSTPVEGVEPLGYTVRSFRKAYAELSRGLKRFGSDRVVIGVLLVLKRRAPKLCTLVYVTNAYLELQELIRKIDPEFTFGKEEETIFYRVAQLINGDLQRVSK